MFIAVLLLCSSLESTSCEVYQNFERSFITLEACTKHLDESVAQLKPGIMAKSYCVLVPGESA